MQKYLAIILLAIAALEGVVAAPLTDAAAVDVRTNEKFPASPVFDGAGDIYGGLFSSGVPFSLAILYNKYIHTEA